MKSSIATELTVLAGPRNTKAIHGLGSQYAGRQGGIACDVLDAWFDPSPRVLQAAQVTAESLRASPDVEGRSLIEAISTSRGIPTAHLSLGAGSSEIIHRVLPTVIGSGDVVLLDPSYSEYPALLHWLGRTIRPLRLKPEDGFEVNQKALVESCRRASALVLVNPNNPTGLWLDSQRIQELSALLPHLTIWVDEAYVDYAPPQVSVEGWAFRSDRVFVLKSLSKAYALSGARAAYLVAPERFAVTVQESTPPWIVSSTATVAAISALEDHAYYRARWAETQSRMQGFAAALRAAGLRVHAGCLPAVLIHTPDGARQTAEALAAAGLFVRVPEGMGDVLGDEWIRVALPRPCHESAVVHTLLEFARS